MKPQDRHEQARRLSESYRKGSRKQKSTVLGAFCLATGLNRKYAIGLLRESPEAGGRVRVGRRRKQRYGPEVIKVLETIWEAADFPWSVRLKAMVPLWLPYVGKTVKVTGEIKAALATISPRTIDRRLESMRTATRRRLYGRTKPGTLLKHQIPVRTERWDVHQPGWGEIDLVSHSGSCGEGEFAHSMNFIDIHSTWVETRAVLGKGQTGILAALETIRRISHSGFADSTRTTAASSSTITSSLSVTATRFNSPEAGRTRRTSVAHVEQKNWTHIRRLVGWERIDTRAAVNLLNELYCNDWRWMMNLFQPSVKLLRKKRIGSRVRRVYDGPATPLDRLLGDTPESSARLDELVALRNRLDPFRPSDQIQAKIDRINRLARRPDRPVASPTKPGSERSHPLLDPPLEGEDAPTRRSKMPKSKKPSVKFDLARRSLVRSDSYLTRQAWEAIELVKMIQSRIERDPAFEIHPETHFIGF